MVLENPQGRCETWFIYVYTLGFSSYNLILCYEHVYKYIVRHVHVCMYLVFKVEGVLRLKNCSPEKDEYPINSFGTSVKVIRGDLRPSSPRTHTYTHTVQVHAMAALIYCGNNNCSI